MISSKAYQEVYEILSLMDKQEVMQIPIYVLNNIKERRDKNFVTKIDKVNIFNRDNISQEAWDLLAWLDVNYWMDEEKKEELKLKSKEYDFKLEEEKKSKYGVDIFQDEDNKIKAVFVDENQDNKKANQMIKKEKTNIFRRIFDFIKNLIK